MTDIIEEFHKYYYNSLVWAHDTKWLGTPIAKLPLDLFLYQEMIYEIKPDVIIESGTFSGGSALFFASMLDLVNNGKVMSIDISPQPNLPVHPRITYLNASSTAKKTLETVTNFINPGDKVMVNLDSDHTKDHVLNELKLYSQLVTVGSYLIVEDTNINGNPVYPDFGPGPMEAVDEFLQDNDQFIIDEDKHKFLLSFHPRGFLKKIK
ncbi:CmcI family methyltransferase [Peribacillus frigoritolerans]|uniref:CmcI family methyltransferase n=1 Tax=Peribacillus frigoritolerans TaxID=450367 RepID=UPI0022816B99|nr:CmcI family methyltransferase [Peribacillus frigoritolerans]MCY8939154.1 cephalosporin hydroxylase family protein [Peribacillus frigoritolerans]